MIRFIVAIDPKRGMADDDGIPWQGKLPTDIKLFREKTKHSVVLMGYGTYVEFEEPLSDRKNLIASTRDETLRPGFEVVTNAREFLAGSVEDVWVIGGAGLFTSTLDLADELYVTQLEREFRCTKFFPDFSTAFEKVSESEPMTENGITFRFQIWRRII